MDPNINLIVILHPTMPIRQPAALDIAVNMVVDKPLPKHSFSARVEALLVKLACAVQFHNRRQIAIFRRQQVCSRRTRCAAGLETLTVSVRQAGVIAGV